MDDTATLSHRDRAVLRAVADGRCQVAVGPGVQLWIDGLCCCDQFVGVRLSAAGLIAADGRDERGPRPARLTAAGSAVLAAA